MRKRSKATITERSKKIIKGRALSQNKGPYSILALAIICLMMTLYYIHQRSPLFDISSEGERSMWAAWPDNTPIYELSHYSIDAEGRSHESPIGTMRVIIESDQITQQLLMRVKTTDRETLLQTELRLRINDSEDRSQSPSTMESEKARTLIESIESRGQYSVAWRELTQERRSWWRPHQAQMSSGGVKCTLK